MPASLPRGWARGGWGVPLCSWLALLWYLLRPLFCERARLCVRASHRKVLSLSHFFLLVIAQFGMLFHVRSLRLSSGHSGLVCTPSTNDSAGVSMPSPSVLVTDGSVWATSPLAVAVRCVFCGFSFSLSWLCCPLRFQNSPQISLWEGFRLCGNFSSFMTPSLGKGLHPYLFCLSFCLLYFILPPVKENGMPFWVPGVLCQHSEVVLWKLLSIEMIFWWVFGGESGLPVLFLCHLGSILPSIVYSCLLCHRLIDHSI